MGPAITVIIPCFNEEEGLPHLERKLGALIAALAPRGGVEALFVDDGSSDGTARGLEALAARLPGSRVLRHASRRGVAAAMRTGFGEAGGDVVLTMDADCTYDPMLFLEFLPQLENHGADIVTASPYHPQGQVVGVPAWRLFLSRSVSRLYRVLLPKKLHTYTALFRAQKSRAAKAVVFRADGFLGVTEFLVRAILRGFHVVEVPAVLQKRLYGASKLKVIPVIWGHLGILASLIWARETLRRNDLA